MLRRIGLTNFKCFDRLDLPCATLNLLCGLNGTGKTSVIQALLLLRQSFETGGLREGRLTVSGPLADLGGASDVLFDDADDELVRLALDSDHSDAPWTSAFRGAGTEHLTAVDPDERAEIPQAWRDVPPFGGLLIHLPAGRITPPRSFSSDRSRSSRQEDDLGGPREYARSFPNDQDEPLKADDPRCVHALGRRPRDVVDHWLQEVCPGAQFNLESVPSDTRNARFAFDRQGDAATRRHRTTAASFGMANVLPVVVALLSEPGSLCLIEHPEAHLHPRGQTRVAELAARAAAAGVQVFVETHSDHFMDGVRIAVHDGAIDSAETAIHYFERHEGRPVVTSPVIDVDGHLSRWPAGFFDQHEENLARLLAPRTRRA